MSDSLRNLSDSNKKQVIEELLAQAKELNTPIVRDDAISMIIKLINASHARQVLEIGSAIGYSAIMMALNTEAKIITIERDEASYLKAKANILKAELESRIELILADALEYELSEDYQCDLLFIDAAKGSYRKFFEKYEPFLSPQGVIVCDNLLFHGMVTDESLCKTKNQRKIADKIRKFNQYLLSRLDFDTQILEIGDGLSVSKRKR